MNLKDKILNKLADRLKKYATKEQPTPEEQPTVKEPPSKKYDFVTCCEISAEIKGAFLTTDCTTVKELKDKAYNGLINVNEILEREFIDDDNSYKSITFCDNDKVVCVYNSRNNTYYEDVHESFETAEKRLYIKCTDIGYKMFKEYINQSGKYHQYIRYSEKIPQQEAFCKIFNNQQLLEQKNSENKRNMIHDNYVQIVGTISNVGKEFTKKDGKKAKFIEIQQECEYNNKIKYNKISVMLSNKFVDEISSLSKGKIVSINGKLNTYVDKENNVKSVINCTEVSILEKSKTSEEKER